MQTGALITFIKRQAADWSRENIRDLISECQIICLTGTPVGQYSMIDTTTGKDPVLTTVAGTFEYEINTTNGFPYDASIISKVYTTDTEAIEYNYGKTNTFDTSIDCNFLEASGDYAAMVVFKDDPGTCDYYVKCFYNPALLLSENTSLLVPDRFHITHLYEGVMGLIEQATNGRSDRWYNFVNNLAKEVRDYLNHGRNSGRGWTVAPRGF